MAITLGNPIIITSGQLATRITTNNIMIDKIYWHQPSLASTSSLLIKKRGAAGPVVATMTCETSGQSQVLELKRMVNDTWCECMPTGTLYIHTR